MCIRHDVGTRDLPARHIDEDVDAAVTAENRFRDTPQGVHVQHVTGMAGRIAAKGSETFQGRGDLLLPVHQCDDIRSLCGKMTGKGAPEDTGGAGDDGDPAFD